MKNDLLINLKGYQYVQKDENSMGCYLYAEYVDEVFDTIIGEQIIQNYMEIYKQIENKTIEDLSLDEVIAYCTFIRRGERFCDGHIAKFIDNGILVKLYERYLKLN